MDGKKFWLATTSLTAVFLLATPAAFAAKEPAASGASNQELLQRIERLENKVQQTNETNGALRTRLSTLEQTSADPVWSFANGRPTITSGDGRFSLSLRTRFQVDTAAFMQKDNLPATVVGRDLGSGTVVRRAYFGVDGRSFKDFWYEFRLNLGGTNAEGVEMNLARVAYVGIPNFRINVGVIQPVFTYGDGVSSGQLLLIERQPIVNIAADTFGGSDSRRGVELDFQKADFLHGGDNFFLTGAFTGNKTGSANGHGQNGGNSGNDEQSQLLGRAGYLLWSNGNSGFQVGASGARLMKLGGNATAGTVTLSERPEIRVDGTTLITTGAIANSKAGTNMWGADAELKLNSFYLAGEYHKYNVERTTGGDANFDGWYVEGSWILTGESKTYNASAMNNEIGSFGAPRVSKPFSLSGGSWGTWEIATRYSDTDLNFREGLALAPTPLGGIRGGEQKIWTVGLNWYLNNNVRLVLEDLMVKVDRLTAAGAQAGQNLNILGFRMQYVM
jgi:phosphate-selective porin OprO/OprP